MTTKLTLSVNNLSDFSVYEEAVRRSHLHGNLPFVEILWDNYCHVAPEKLLQYLSRFSDRVAFHVMWSRFLERDQWEFEDFLQQLKFYVSVIQPVYVSDHLCRFQIDGVHLRTALEIDYVDYDAVCHRIDRYQECIGTQVLFENYASTNSMGCRQVEFFNSILIRTGCGLLFDISNARVAANNGFVPLSDWLELLGDVDGLRCHVGSYLYNAEDGCYQDSHGEDISDQTLQDIQMVLDRLNVQSLCYEREYRKTSQAIARDLNLIQMCLATGVT